ncbi:MAG: MBL fold metallo-hydrolase [Gemmatimonadales bacterium]
MLFIRFYDDQLAQTSYLVGCGTTGAAVVIDPSRHVDQYIAAAEAEGLRVEAVTETHIHADFVSGTRELAARTGARIYLSRCGTPDWQYGFAKDPQVSLVGDRDRLAVGRVELLAVHTPGHTPEHLSFLVTDRDKADEPMGILTGDFVFVGDVGRPDLLEKAARVEGSAEAGAKDLYRSLGWFRTLPDHLQVWPGHGAGSACGKDLSAVPQSTVGYERRFNWAFGAETEVQFVRQVLAGQPEPPRYFARMKRMNREGPPVLGTIPLPERVAEHRIPNLLGSGAVVVDTRPGADFAEGHLAGSLSIPFNKSFPGWAGSIIPYDRDLYLVVDEARARLPLVVRCLVSVGIDRIAGYVGPEALDAAGRNGHPLESADQVSVQELAARRDDLFILDVRAASEWRSGHIPGATLVPLAELPDRLGEIPADRTVAVHCQGGSRSAIAASLLRAGGRRAANVPGGFAAWMQAGFPVSRE